MKKFLTVLLVIAVMFTFSFGSAFAVTEAQNENVQAIKAETARLQANLASAGTAYLNTLTWDADGYTSVASTKISKAVYEAQMALYVAAAQTALNETSVYLQTAASADANSSVTRTAWLAYLMSGVATDESGLDAGTRPAVAKKGYSELTTFAGATTDTNIGNDALAVAEYKAVVADANAKLAEYAAKLGDYSTNPNAWKVTNTSGSAYYTYAGSTADKYALSAAAGMNSGQELDAQGFVEAVIDTQKAAVNSDTNKVTGASGAQTKLDAIAGALQMAKDIIEGHKVAAAPENYYIAAVPTAAELAADTTVASVKENAIAKMKAELASAQIKMKSVLNDALSAENKKAKPNNELVAKLQKALADLSKQVAATEEVYTALINDCDTVAEVNGYYDVSAGTGTIKDIVVDVMAATADYADNNNAKETFTATGTEKGAEYYLKDFLTRSESVAALKEYAALLAEVKDVNGEKFYDAVALAEALEDEIIAVYKGRALDTAKTNLAGDYEVSLMKAQKAYIQFITGNTAVTNTGGYFNTTKPKDKYGVAVNNVWNKSTAKTTGTPTTIYHKTGNAAVESAVKVALYDDAQAAELKALVADTKAAIEAATTITEIEDAFAAAHAKYILIDTTADHAGYWAATSYGSETGKLAIAAKKDGYPDSLYSYATYLMSTVDPAKYNVNAAALYGVGAEVLYEAYAKDELATKFTAAKAAMDAALITKADVNAKKAEVEAAIAAIGTVTLDSKDAIVAACDALDAYTDLAGTNPVVSNEYVLDAAKVAYYKLADAELTKAYKALPATAKVTLADKDAIEALRAAYDAYEVLSDDYGFNTSTVTNDNVEAYEKALSNAKVAAAAELMYKLPANPTAADRAQVEAAKAAYDALTLGEKIALREGNALAYDNLIDAEEALGINNDEAAKAYVQDLSIKARSTKTSKGVKVTIKADVQELLDSGYTVEYKFYRSTKSNKNFGTAKVTKTENTYLNTAGKKGTKYYYKAKLVVKNAAGEVVATTPLTQCLYATRTF